MTTFILVQDLNRKPIPIHPFSSLFIAQLSNFEKIYLHKICTDEIFNSLMTRIWVCNDWSWVSLPHFLWTSKWERIFWSWFLNILWRLCM